MATPVNTVPFTKLSERELTAWRGMLVLHGTLVKALDAQLEAEHDLPLSSYEVLMFVADSPDGRMRMSDVADRVLLSRSGLTRLVDRLERDGLVVRDKDCPNDARGTFAVITDEGRRTLDAARATHLAGVRALFLDHLSPEEQDMVGQLFDRVLTQSAIEDPRGMCPSNENG